MALIVVERNREAVITKLCELIKTVSDASISENNVFNVGVSGGSLATFLQIGLPQIQTEFTKWRVFFCDERLVPEDSSDSTFGTYKKHLIGAINLKEEQFVQIKQGLSAEATAADYRQQMARYFPDATLPRFDMLLLGMGPDGHTCSLFPGHKLLAERDTWVAAITDSPKPPPARVTLTFPVINNAKNCVFAVCGIEKADMVKRILVDKDDDLPATRVNPPNGKLYWILDSEAGQHIQQHN